MLAVRTGVNLNSGSGQKKLFLKCHHVPIGSGEVILMLVSGGKAGIVVEGDFSLF
jgi:hypothetical protein